ncbi:N-lysine methyltransferase KMT5A-like [Paramacrobiotus metropolitanus]|uniref:N-lysine methyltransferase KMT5A-like n=1 Tax=Paramacrobiotus metropolitanus TaxID=2943436 RepID=UPI0024461439|nr:N-lysine methyltransferase KMT5A-like [Paramacrobiotus metropolitanus]
MTLKNTCVGAARRNPPRKAVCSSKQTTLTDVFHRQSARCIASDFIADPEAPEAVTLEEDHNGELVAASEQATVDPVGALEKSSSALPSSGLRKPSPFKVAVRKHAVQNLKAPPNTPSKKDVLASAPTPRTPIKAAAMTRGHLIISPEIAPAVPKIGRRPLTGTATIRGSQTLRLKSERVKASLELCVRRKEEMTKIVHMIVNGLEDPGVESRIFEGKGRGLVARRIFEENDFVVEYAGDLVDIHRAKNLEEEYAKEPTKYGCYMYYFSHKGKKLCVDATAETERLGRLLNHSCRHANLRPEVMEIPISKQKIHLILRATRKIAIDEELLYDYGDRDPKSLAAFPWLKQ